MLNDHVAWAQYVRRVGPSHLTEWKTGRNGQPKRSRRPNRGFRSPLGMGGHGVADHCWNIPYFTHCQVISGVECTFSSPREYATRFADRFRSTCSYLRGAMFFAANGSEQPAKSGSRRHKTIQAGSV